MRNYLDQFYQTGNYKYDYVSFGDGMRAQGFDAGGGQYIAGADTHSDNMASSSVSTRLAGETTLSSAVKLQNYTAIRNLNFMLCNLDNCVEKDLLIIISMWVRLIISAHGIIIRCLSAMGA